MDGHVKENIDYYYNKVYSPDFVENHSFYDSSINTELSVFAVQEKMHWVLKKKKKPYTAKSL